MLNGAESGGEGVTDTDTDTDTGTS